MSTKRIGSASSVEWINRSSLSSSCEESSTNTVKIGSTRRITLTTYPIFCRQPIAIWVLQKTNWDMSCRRIHKTMTPEKNVLSWKAPDTHQSCGLGELVRTDLSITIRCETGGHHPHCHPRSRTSDSGWQGDTVTVGQWRQWVTVGCSGVVVTGDDRGWQWIVGAVGDRGW